MSASIHPMVAPYTGGVNLNLGIVDFVFNDFLSLPVRGV